MVTKEMAATIAHATAPDSLR